MVVASNQLARWPPTEAFPVCLIDQKIRATNGTKKITSFLLAGARDQSLSLRSDWHTASFLQRPLDELGNVPQLGCESQLFNDARVPKCDCQHCHPHS